MSGQVSYPLFFHNFHARLINKIYMISSANMGLIELAFAFVLDLTIGDPQFIRERFIGKEVRRERRAEGARRL
jgi:hypothetical protein